MNLRSPSPKRRSLGWTRILLCPECPNAEARGSCLKQVRWWSTCNICTVYMYIYGGFLKMGVPKMDQNGWFKMEHPFKMDDFGVPTFQETFIWCAYFLGYERCKPTRDVQVRFLGMNQQSMWNHVDVAEQVKLCRTKMSTLANKWGCNLQSWRYAALGVQQWWNMWEVKDSWSWTFIAIAQQNMPWLCEKGQHCSNFGWVAACAPRKLVFLNRQTFYARSFLLRQWFFGVCLRENLTGSHYGFSQ